MKLLIFQAWAPSSWFDEWDQDSPQYSRQVWVGATFKRVKSTVLLCFISDLFSQKETEIQEKLDDCQAKLLQARVDRHESEKEIKFKETLESLTRAFPGVHGRLIDLCRPSQKKFEKAVEIILGKNMDSIVVDTERTAIQCIEVHF